MRRSVCNLEGGVLGGRRVEFCKYDVNLCPTRDYT